MVVDVTKALERAYCRLAGVRDRIEVRKIHAEVDNEVREDHHLAVQHLKDIQRVNGLPSNALPIPVSYHFTWMLSTRF